MKKWMIVLFVLLLTLGLNSGSVLAQYSGLKQFYTTIVWDDENDQDGLRPESVTVDISGTAGGTKVKFGTYDIKAKMEYDDPWTYFTSDYSHCYEVTFVKAFDQNLHCH